MKRERRFLIVLAVELILAVFGTIRFGMVSLCFFSGLIMLFMIYNYLQMKSIRELSDYMMRVRNGEYTLELRDYQEGELSILKSEVYKTTLMLTEQAELMKKDKLFLANAISDISHQLKTPLTSMGLMVDLLNDNNLSCEKRMEFLGNLNNGVERISWLVSALLKMSKLDAGAVIFKGELTAISKILENVKRQISIPMELKNQTLIIQENNEARATFDFAWMVEAITNIVKNCIEHTKVGGTIQIEYEETSFYTVIIIRDNGEGISKEDLPHVFERFYKGKNSSADSVGIGLALAKQIITLQKGVITVESVEGSGSIFTIKIYR